MDQEITKENLYSILYNKLTNMPELLNMYIGKTDNVERRKEEHKIEFEYTVEIAYGDVQSITEAEKFLISKFKVSNLPCKNKGNGGEGTPNATKLYVSYNYDKSKMKKIEELDDDELDIVSYKLKK